jgi:hypothetical protein
MKKSEVCRVTSGGPVIRINFSISAFLAGFIESATAGVTSKQNVTLHAIRIFIINALPRFIAGIYRGEARSGFKTPSKAQWLRCRPPANAHPPEFVADGAFPTCPAIARRLALEPDLRL